MTVLAGLLVLAAPNAISAASEGATESQAFDCYAPNPRSRIYDAGDYIHALKELQALAGDTCPQARHLLAVMAARAGKADHQDLVRALRVPP